MFVPLSEDSMDESKISVQLTRLCVCALAAIMAMGSIWKRKANVEKTGHEAEDIVESNNAVVKMEADERGLS